MARFFHSLVVFGACVTLARCGGRLDGEAKPDGGDGTGGSAGSSSEGGGAAAGGTRGLLDAGRAPEGGGGGLIDPFPDTDGGLAPDLPALGPEAQWNCTDQLGDCARRGSVLVGPCPVQASRPTSPEDCASDERLRCTLAELDGREVLVGCDCVTRAPRSARDCGCQGATTCEQPIFSTCDDDLAVCGCYALACITR